MGTTIHTLEVGLGKNLTYLIVDEDTGQGAVVDPAFESDRILRWVRDNCGVLRHVLVTHTHMDHVEAVGNVARVTGADVQVHALEADKLPDDVDRDVIRPHDGAPTLTLGETIITGLHTPGHTPGGTTYLTGMYALTGDVLFVSGCGRADLVGGDPEALYRSLYDVILDLPPETIVLPGHDYGPRPRSTLWDEVRENVYLKFRNDPDGFRQFRLNSRGGKLINIKKH